MLVFARYPKRNTHVDNMLGNIEFVYRISNFHHV